MPRPLAIFSLIALNEPAEAVITHRINGHLVSALDNGRLVLDIGHVHSKFHGTLAALGRDCDNDVVIEGASISRYQCSFEIDWESDVVWLFDKSTGNSTQVMGQKATQFSTNHIRKVMVEESANIEIMMGVDPSDCCWFQLIWWPNAGEKIKNFKSQRNGYEVNPRLAHTRTSEDSLAMSSKMLTRVRVNGPRVRYTIIGSMLGQGRTGEVYKARDIEGKKDLAVKIIKVKTEANQDKEENWRRTVDLVKREVDEVANLHHVSKDSSNL